VSDLKEKIKIAIDRIQSFESLTHHFADDGMDGYYLAFSGGKDSVVVKRLMDMAGVKYDAHYRLTSVDPPELVRFIKREHPDVAIDVPRYKGGNDEGRPITMWNLIPKKRYPPTRVARYCCEYLKEDGGDGRMTVTGVRWAESVNRAKNQGLVTVMGKKAGKELADDDNFRETGRGGVVLVNDNSESRKMLDACVTRHKTCLNPIIDWTNHDVWDFIRAEEIPYCELYDEGWHRLGCIGCPMASQKERSKAFGRWPKYKSGYIRAFDKMLRACAENGKPWRGITTADGVRHTAGPDRPAGRI
jgi:phosphoadenosine phosphosulfate reductase